MGLELRREVTQMWSYTLGVIHDMKYIEVSTYESVCVFPRACVSWSLCVYVGIHELECHIHHNFLSDLRQCPSSPDLQIKG